MRKITLILIAVFTIGLLARADEFTENFASDPATHGWQVFGDGSLFQWNAANQNLEVTWDSTHPNSYFFKPLGTSVARSDDFTYEFDMLLKDAVSGNEPGKTGGFEIGIGLFNYATATSASFMRGVFGGAPDICEFDYFPSGYFDFGGTIYDVDATTTPTFISTNSFDYAPTIFAPYIFEIPTNLVVHVKMSFTATNQTLGTVLTTNGMTMIQFPDVMLTDTNTSGFTEIDDVRLDTFSISSYSSTGDDFDSVLAHGTIDNVKLTYSHPVGQFTGAPKVLAWEGQFLSRSNWLYTLECSADLKSWTGVSPAVSGTGATLAIQDGNPLQGKAFYRVRATRP